MDDRNPAKLLMCAHDVLGGIVQPWHLGTDHLERINTLRAGITDAVDSRADDELLLKLMADCVVLIDWLTDDSKGVHRVYERFDRARLIFRALELRLTSMLDMEKKN